MKTSTKKNQEKKVNARDYTKYMFEGKQYGKGTLVLAVVRKYVEMHPTVTLEKLKSLFPKKEVHSSFEVVETVRKAEKGRFFLSTDNIIKIKDAKVAVSSQWGKNNIESFIDYAKKELGLKIQQKRSLQIAA